MPKKKVDVGRKRKLWDPARMAQAISVVREKEMGFLKASKMFGVPRALLFRLVNSKEQDATKVASTILGLSLIHIYKYSITLFYILLYN